MWRKRGYILGDTMTDDIWWQESPFVWAEEVFVDSVFYPPAIDPVDTLVNDLLPSIRFEGDKLETDLSPVGLTEWIPGVDPISELIEDSMLPPLPPAVTTLMKSYQRGEDVLPKGSGHVNIMIDLSGSMYCGAGTDSSGQDHNVASVAQALTRIMVNACRQGKHSFAVFTFGTSGGDQCTGPNATHYGCATRQIWGSTLAEAKDYDGFIANMKLNSALGSGTGDWSNMMGNHTGYACERVYRYMEREVGSQIPDVTAATCFFITDAVWGDMYVPGYNEDTDGNRLRDWVRDGPDPYPYGKTPTDPTAGILDLERINRVGSHHRHGEGVWYWAKKYHDDFGPFVLFKINSPSQAGETLQAINSNPNHEFTRQGQLYKRVFREYVGGDKGYEKCVFQGLVELDVDGGTLPAVAKSLVAFINDLGGRNAEPLCGGKGVTF